MSLDYVVSAFVTLLVVVDPIGLVPVFAGLTAGLPQQARQQVAVRACAIAAAILFGTAIAGEFLLRSLGITPPAFEIAGGLLLFLVAAEMVIGTRLKDQSRTAEQAIEEHVRNIAAFPIAIPLMAGPGAICGDRPALVRSLHGPDVCFAAGGYCRRVRRHPVGIPFRRSDHAPDRHYRQCGAVKAPRHHPGRTRRAICD
jgi:hypothetical protein